MDAQDRLEIHELISRCPLEGRRPGWLNGRFRGSGARRHVDTNQMMNETR
jgi:hypothetical protein